MKKRIIFASLIICTVIYGYSQDCPEMLEKKIFEVDSLQKVIQQNEAFMTSAQTNQRAMRDTINSLRSELLSLENFRSQRKSMNALLKIKSDSIVWLKTQISHKNDEIISAKQQGVKKSKEEFERGQTEALATIVKTYKKPFNDLIKISSKESVQRDISIVGNNQDINHVLHDLKMYFSALELLSKKFDLTQIRNAQIQLNQIQHESTLLDKLKKNIDMYQRYNEGLREVLTRLIALDRLESVAGMNEEIRNKKFNKIMSELTAYFFNYDFNLQDYPYLTEIVLEIIKRKQPNPDYNITDLLNKFD